MSGSTTPTPAQPQHEALCNNCGKCCYKKIIVGRSVFITPFPCEFLNTDTNLCTVYERRFELNPLCLSMEEGFKVNAFPEDCPYVPEMAPPKYKPARDDWNWAEEWDEFDKLADDLDVSAEMRAKVRARGPEAAPMYVETYARIQAERATPPQLWGSGSPNLIDLRSAGAPTEGVDDTPSLAALAAGTQKVRSARLDRVTRKKKSAE